MGPFFIAVVFLHSFFLRKNLNVRALEGSPKKGRQLFSALLTWGFLKQIADVPLSNSCQVFKSIHLLHPITVTSFCTFYIMRNIIGFVISSSFQRGHIYFFIRNPPKKTSKVQVSEYLSNRQMRIWTLMQN